MGPKDIVRAPGKQGPGPFLSRARTESVRPHRPEVGQARTMARLRQGPPDHPRRSRSVATHDNESDMRILGHRPLWWSGPAKFFASAPVEGKTRAARGSRGPRLRIPSTPARMVLTIFPTPESSADQSSWTARWKARAARSRRPRPSEEIVFGPDAKPDRPEARSPSPVMPGRASAASPAPDFGKPIRAQTPLKTRPTSCCLSLDARLDLDLEPRKGSASPSVCGSRNASFIKRL